MNKLSLFLLLVAAMLLASCGGGGEKSASLAFAIYEKNADAVTPEGVPAGLVISFAIPQGEGAELIADAEKRIVASAEIAEALGAPEGETLEAIAASYEDRFKSGMAEGELAAPCMYQLQIACQYQDVQVVVLHVTDGVYGNGGPQEYLRIVSMSDGRLLERSALTTLTDADIRKLAFEFADDDTKEFLQENEHEDFWIAPDSAGCKVKLQTGSHFFADFLVPVERIAAYLTEEGRALFGSADGKPAAVADEPEEQPAAAEPAYEPGRGDLGGYDLRGPVKKVTYPEWSASFNEQGQLTAENGQSLKNIFPGGVTRNKDGRLSECNADGYGSRYYTYNAKGLPTEIVEDGEGRTITYDADGYVKTESMVVSPDIGDDEGKPEVFTFTYTIVEKDSYGNWTKRRDQDGYVTTRTISYYE